jgi:hypothetical protein
MDFTLKPPQRRGKLHSAALSLISIMLRHPSNLLFLTVLCLGLAACGKKERSKPEAGQTRETPLASANEAAALAGEIEALTGQHTRVVWSHYQKTKVGDPYSNGGNALLMGLDTRDGLGARTLLKKEGNYSRPLLTTDGNTILYTVKGVDKDAQGIKRYDLAIMRTDFQGSGPVRLADGYAVDTWRDRQGVEWVYAVDDIVPSHLIAMEARRLVRFHLDDPSRLELVWDQTTVGPDNIQLSRDGTRASGQFPWPNVGQFIFAADTKASQFQKFLTGCWPSLAPDDSHVSWVLDGEHKHATFFTGDGSRSWKVDFTSAPHVGGHEIYHPRWTNHPRFITLTGPYIAERGGDGSVIGKGGLTSEVHIGKLSDDLTKVVKWVRVTDNERGDNFPDVWIAGGEKESLPLFAKQAGTTASPAATWPVTKDGLAFLWENRNANNAVKLPDGRLLDCSLESRGAARYGRHWELLLDAGTFHPKREAAEHLRALWSSSVNLTFECLLRSGDKETAGKGELLRLPGFVLSRVANQLSLTPAAGAGLVYEIQTPLPWHLVVALEKTGADALVTVFINGKQIANLTMANMPGGDAGEARFGSSSGGLGGGLKNIALYGARLSDEVIAQHARLLLDREAALPAAPARVRLRGKLVETSAMPTAEGLGAYTGGLVAYVYEVQQVLSGEYPEKRVLVRHWAMLDRQIVAGFPRKEGGAYEIELEPVSAHPELAGERVMDDTTALDLDPWYDVRTPALK